MATFADRALNFFSTLDLDVKLPRGVTVMNPYPTPEVQRIMHRFFKRFYSDNRPRVFVWGINPGRHGGGLTGLPFTDPYALKHFLDTPHTLTGRRETSSQFIYQVIESLGGVEKFYGRFYINSLCPLGLLKDGLNYNFYDDPATMKTLTPFIVQSMQLQMDFGAKRGAAVCLGTGKLYKFFQAINSEHRFFKTILPVEHPRFIMQYNRRKMNEFLLKYQQAFEAASTL
ncbi:MAG: DUF4918 family protein [Rhizobacter sp.]|nr:DUF4918 family protein [Chlorobiales bacterium]